MQQESAPTVFGTHATDSAAPLDLRARANEWLSRYGMSRYLVWFFPGALLLSVGVIFLGHHARGLADRRPAIAITSARSVPRVLTPSTGEQPTSALPVTLSSDVPGFVLQVASMKHENNAEALEKTLHQKNFPAFVFRRGAGTFYQVAVGVYGDAVSAGRVKLELESQGVKAVLKRWLPE